MRINLPKKLRLPPIIIGVAILFFLILIIFRPGSKSLEQMEKTWPVKIEVAQVGNFTPNLILYGNIESPRSSELVAAITADIMETPAQEGNKVSKGDLLVKLDDRDAKLLVEQRHAEVNEFKAQLGAEETRYQSDLLALEHEEKLVELMRKEAERFETLLSTQAVSESAVDNAKEDLRKQQLDLTSRKLSVENHENRLAQLNARLNRRESLEKQAQLDLERASVRAPFDGRITKLHVSPGDRVQDGELLIEMFDLSAIEIRSQIPSQYLKEIKNSISAGEKLTASAVLDQNQITLELDRIASSIDIGRAGVDALFKLTTPVDQIALGRSIEINLNMPEVSGAYAIPTEALYGNNRIYILNGDRMKSIQVQQIGYINVADGQHRALIKSSELSDEDQIITTQLPNARTGLKVRIVE